MKKILKLSFLFLIFTGCNEEEEIQKWIDKVDNLRSKVEQELPITPYQDSQHQAFKEYFSELNQMILKLGDDEELIKPFNGVVSKSDLVVLCPKIFLSKENWMLLMGRCQKNRFFLCAEEVRSYPTIVSRLREHLGTEQQKRFDEVSACREISEVQ